MADDAPLARVVIVRPDGTRVVKVLAGEGGVDLATVGALARLHLDARRAGASITVAEMSAGLEELLELCGLRPMLEGSGGQVHREAEAREDAVGVEERVDPGDPPA
jgi:hypothetical protein